MASVRPIPESYYYSGQGRLAIGDRNESTGALSNLVFVGNVTSLTIDIATTKFEHKESMSGGRLIDLTIIQEKNATFKFSSESLDLISSLPACTARAARLPGRRLPGRRMLPRRARRSRWRTRISTPVRAT